MKFTVRKKSKVESTDLDGVARVEMVAHLRCSEGAQDVSFHIADPAEYDRVELGAVYELKAHQ